LRSSEKELREPKNGDIHPEPPNIEKREKHKKRKENREHLAQYLKLSRSRDQSKKSLGSCGGEGKRI